VRQSAGKYYTPAKKHTPFVFEPSTYAHRSCGPKVSARKIYAPDTLVEDYDRPVRIAPFAAWPHFGHDELATVAAILSSGKVNYWTGEQGKLFESEFAAFVGSKYAIAVTNGTVALELALYALGIGPGDEVIVPCRTFIASGSCAVMRGAVPVMADVDPISQNITAQTIEAVLTPRTRAVICVHLAGWPCDMDPIMELAQKHGLKVIEDCAQAHGATYKGRAVGSIGHAAAFSFCQDKIMTTGGEGGMLTTSDRELWEKAWSFKDHGKNYSEVCRRDHPAGFRWLHESFGTNMRLTELQAGIGRCQLKKLSWWRTARRNNAALLTKSFSALPALRVTTPAPGFGHAYYKYYVFVRPERLAKGWNRDRILEAINAEGVPCYTGSCSEIYLEKAFAGAGLQPEQRLQVARELGETSLMFLVHPTLGPADMADTCRAVEKVLARAAA
jgi:dTDP-4-amino-4,6-dideoxygalactose transaminase